MIEPSDYERDRATDQVFDSVRNERWRQRNEHGFSEDHDDALPLSAWSYVLAHRAVLVGHPFPVDAGIDHRRLLIEVAAIAVAAVESIDRKSGRMQTDAAHFTPDPDSPLGGP